MSRLDLNDFLSGYLTEVDEHLTASNAHLLAIEAQLRKGEPHPRAVRDTFRALHTIKGLSAMVGIEPVVAIAHEMETALHDADQRGGRLAAESIEALLAGIRAIESRVRALADGKPVAAAPVDLIDRLVAVEAHQAGEAPFPARELALPHGIAAKLGAFEREQLVRGLDGGKQVLVIEFRPSSELASSGYTVSTVRERIAALAEIVKVIPLATPVSADAPAGLAFAIVVLSQRPGAVAELAAAAGVAAESLTRVAGNAPALDEAVPEVSDLAARHSVVRVEVSRLEAALEPLSALVVTRFRLARVIARLKAEGTNVRELQQIMVDNTRQLRDLRAAIMRIRLVSVSELLERVPLLVRGLQRSTGKKVRLEIDAGKAELDKGVAERLFPALVHLIRNAVDHAIEPPEERLLLGKPPEGLLRVVCHERGSSRLELVVSDDGRGVDRDRIATRARRAVPDNDNELLELMCIPGLSSRSQASATSGRGLGMDIVKRIAVGELGGELELKTEAGKGTAITVRVPLSLSILDAFAFECSRQRFVVPVSMIEEIVEIDPATVISAPSARGRRESRIMRRRGRGIPLFGLAEIFDLPAEAPRKAMVVRRRDELYAFAVDRILGQQEIVVRPLLDPLVTATGITGSTDLGDGQPTLLVDLLALTGSLLVQSQEVQQ